MRTRVGFILFWLALSVSPVYAQTVFSGVVTDVDLKTLPGISLTLHPVRGDGIIGFGITDAEGRFSIALKSDLDSVRLRVYGLGWASWERPLINRSQIVGIRLTAQPITLREVRVKPPPITQHRDTITYSVDAFKNKSDRVIADVIRKLPGIEVENDGRILYQGKPINKYYIEGMDLLETKYRLANDNLPAEAVVQVEVLENHQPVRVLDSLVFSDRAALNIRLKKNVTTTGTAHAGAGGGPLLWDVNLTPMLFTRTNQLIASVQANNTGVNVARQLKNISPGTVFNPLQNDDEKKDWVAIQPMATPSFDETRWLNNTSQLGTINYLKKLSRDYEIRLNAAYVHDYQQQRGSTRTTYYTPTDTVRLLENDYNQLYFRSLETRLTIQKNSNRKYFRNELAAKGNWDSQRGTILLNELPVSQQVTNPFFWLSNTFTDIVRMGKTLLTLRSDVTVNRAPQSLAVTPGQYAELVNGGRPYQSLRQQVLASSFATTNTASLTQRLGHVTLLLELGLTVQKQRLTSYLTTDEIPLTGSDFTNHLNWFRLNAFLKLKTQYRKNAWRLDLDSPLNYYRFRIQDDPANKSQRLNRLVLEPRFTVNYDIDAFWSASGNVGYRTNFGDLDDVYYGYLLRTYRTLQRRDVPLPTTRSTSGAIGLNYRNSLTSLFGSFYYTYSLAKNNVLYRSHVAANGALEYSAVNQPNDASIQLLTGQIGSYLPSIKATVRGKVSWSTTAGSQLINGSPVQLTNQTISPSLSLAANVSKRLDVEYAYNLSLFRTNLSTQTRQRTYQQKHLLRTNVYINQTNFLTVENEYYRSQLTTGPVRNVFTNVLYRCVLPKKKIELETRWTNVWNTSSLTTVALAGFSYVESVFELRPVQVVQKIRFSF